MTISTTIKDKNRNSGPCMSSTTVTQNRTNVQKMENQTTFSQDDEIDEDLETHDFPITLIELLNDLEYGHPRRSAVIATMERRKGYDGDRDSIRSGTDDHSHHVRRQPPCTTEPKKNGSMYKEELLSAWTLEPTDVSSHPMNISKNEVTSDEDAFQHSTIEPDLTNFASSKEDESSSEGSQPPIFMGWCGIMATSL